MPSKDYKAPPPRRPQTAHLKRRREIDLQAIVEDFFADVRSMRGETTALLPGCLKKIPTEETAERIRAICDSYLCRLDGGQD